eukprot:4951930-Prymnesium_polylepis.1
MEAELVRFRRRRREEGVVAILEQRELRRRRRRVDHTPDHPAHVGERQVRAPEDGPRGEGDLGLAHARLRERSVERAQRGELGLRPVEEAPRAEARARGQREEAPDLVVGEGLLPLRDQRLGPVLLDVVAEQPLTSAHRRLEGDGVDALPKQRAAHAAQHVHDAARLGGANDALLARHALVDPRHRRRPEGLLQESLIERQLAPVGPDRLARRRPQLTAAAVAQPPPPVGRLRVECRIRRGALVVLVHRAEHAAQRLLRARPQRPRLLTLGVETAKERETAPEGASGASRRGGRSAAATAARSATMGGRPSESSDAGGATRPATATAKTTALAATNNGDDVRRRATLSCAGGAGGGGAGAGGALLRPAPRGVAEATGE